MDNRSEGTALGSENKRSSGKFWNFVHQINDWWRSESCCPNLFTALWARNKENSSSASQHTISTTTATCHNNTNNTNTNSMTHTIDHNHIDDVAGTQYYYNNDNVLEEEEVKVGRI